MIFDNEFSILQYLVCVRRSITTPMLSHFKDNVSSFFFFLKMFDTSMFDPNPGLMRHSSSTNGVGPNTGSVISSSRNTSI